MVWNSYLVKKSEIEKVGGLDGDVKIVLKSGLKKPSGSSQSGQLGSEENTAKGRVQWLDFLGEELAEIKEFEPASNSEEPEDDDDDDDNENRSCKCVIQ